jgi:hypothetical protein
MILGHRGSQKLRALSASFGLSASSFMHRATPMTCVTDESMPVHLDIYRPHDCRNARSWVCLR